MYYKDLHVEVDAIAGLRPQPGVLDVFAAAFATAPVSNPDGGNGIRLHIVGGGGCDSCEDESDIPVAP